ncbi:MAG: hypothetical protein ACFFER_17440 [Candidatus Thorarchaeota archaeon]
MSELEAAWAPKLVNPKVVIPMHYDTFPVISADSEEFKSQVNETMKDVRGENLRPGGTIELSF